MIISVGRRGAFTNFPPANIERHGGMRRTVRLLAAVASAVLLACGVVLLTMFGSIAALIRCELGFMPCLIASL